MYVLEEQTLECGATSQLTPSLLADIRCFDAIRKAVEEVNSDVKLAGPEVRTEMWERV